MRIRTMAIIPCCVMVFVLSGCGGIFQDSSPPTGGAPIAGADIALTQHNPVSLYNYRTAREYSAQGRYELAKEHFLLAYAAAGDDVILRDMLARELESVDLMIRTLR